MKRSFLALILAVVAIGGAFATQQTPAKQKPVNNYTYYLSNACDTPVICDEEYPGPLCSVAFENTEVYDQPTCQEIHKVAVPLGRLPL